MQIKLQNLGSELSSRNKAIEFFNDVNFGISESVVLDFGGVKTITPSFAHEMLSIILKGEQNRRISFKNTNETIVFQLKKALISLKGTK